MPTFRYKAYSKDGQFKSGTVDATSEQAATKQLTTEGITPFSIETGGAGWFSFSGGGSLKSKVNLNEKELAAFFGELGTLVSSGLPLDDALLLAQKVSPRSRIASVYETLRAKSSEGQPFSKSLEETINLPSFVTAIFESAEATSSLKNALSVVAEDYRRRQNTTEEITKALAYPVFLILLLAAVMALLSTQLVPALLPIFSGSEAEIPFVLQMMTGMGEFLSQNGFVITLVLLVLFISLLLRPVRRGLGLMVLSVARKLPVVGPFLKRMMVARYLRTFAAMVQNKVPLTDGLKLAAQVVRLNSDQQSFNAATREVTEGGTLHDALGTTGLIEDYALSMVSIGEETNNLAEMLTQCATIEQTRVMRIMNTLLGALSPTLTIIIGVLVGSVVISVMSALLSINAVVLQ